MVLEALSQSSRNELESNSNLNLQKEATDSRPSKRVKRVHSRPSLGSKDKGKGKETAPEDSEKDDSQISADIDAAAFDDPDGGLDASLPAADDNDEVVQEYTRTGKYRRSMYVDAFNLALDTVLQDELHLFSDAEQDIFAKYRSLEYEPQFLYAIHDHLTLLQGVLTTAIF